TPPRRLQPRRSHDRAHGARGRRVVRGGRASARGARAENRRRLKRRERPHQVHFSVHSASARIRATMRRTLPAMLTITLLLAARDVVAHEGHSRPAKSPGAPAASPAEDPEACPPPGQIAQRLQARYDTTKNFRADFRQATSIAAMGQGEEAFGTVV